MTPQWLSSVAIVLTACGGATRADDGDDAGVDSAPSPDAAGEVAVESAPAADAPSDADPQSDAPLPDPESCDYPVEGIHACCHGKLCRGMCHPTTGDCECGGIDGGCWIPTVC